MPGCFYRESQGKSICRDATPHFRPADLRCYYSVTPFPFARFPSKSFMSGAYAPEKKTVTSYAPVQLANLYRDIFVHSNEPIAILDPQGHYLEQNVAHRELLGYSDEELQGKTPAVHMGEDVFSTIAHALASEGEYRGEILSRRKDGEVRHIELSAFATRDDDGSPICYVGIKRDITDRKKAEEALRRTELELTDF